MPNVKLGADPEFEVRTKEGSFVPADRVLGYNTTSQVGTDGASSTGELRPKPGTVAEVTRDIRKLIGLLESRVGPSNEVFAGSGQEVALGGHIHVSGLGHRMPGNLRGAMDRFIAGPLNSISNTQVRKERGYGKCGEDGRGEGYEWRVQPHGFEYRTPLSWISHPVIAKGVLRVTQLLVEAYQEGVLGTIAERKDLLRYGRLKGAVKGTPNPSMAYYDVKSFYQFLDRALAKGIKLEQVRVFQAWKKRPFVPVAAETPKPKMVYFLWRDGEFLLEIEHRLNPCGEGWYQEYEARFGIAPRERDVVFVHVDAARQSRTGNKAIFVSRQLLQCIGTEPITESIPCIEWERDGIGLSYALRINVEEAVEALRIFRHRYEEKLNARQSSIVPEADLVAILEGRE